MSIRWKSIFLALVVIVAGGAVRLPLEQRYTAEMRRRNLLEEPLKLSMRDQLEQTAFFAVLGGFRSVVASIMELRSITPYTRSNYARVEECYAICTRLQPREAHYWETRAWHQAYNSRDTYRYEYRLTEANREVLAQQAVENGIRIVREGLTWLPDSWKLWDRLADYNCMQWNQKPNYNVAADCYEKAAAIKGAPGFLRRMHVYQVARIPGREWEAWNKLLALYNSPGERDRTPSVERELVRLFLVDRIFERHREAVPPPELFRLFNPASVLTAEEQKHRAQIADAIQRHRTPRSSKARPPQVTSPGLQKVP